MKLKPKIKMSQTVAKIIDRPTAQALADKWVEVYGDINDSYTTLDIAASKLASNQYSTVTITDALATSLGPVPPLRKFFPR